MKVLLVAPERGRARAGATFDMMLWPAGDGSFGRASLADPLRTKFSAFLRIAPTAKDAGALYDDASSLADI
jgi:hypothetical protein